MLPIVVIRQNPGCIETINFLRFKARHSAVWIGALATIRTNILSLVLDKHETNRCLAAPQGRSPHRRSPEGRIGSLTRLPNSSTSAPASPRVWTRAASTRAGSLHRLRRDSFPGILRAATAEAAWTLQAAVRWRITAPALCMRYGRLSSRSTASADRSMPIPERGNDPYHTRRAGTWEG
jgi:hypothetical protein